MKNKKSLLLLIIFSIFLNFMYSQESNQSVASNSDEASVVISDYENSTTYFNNSAENETSTRSGYKTTSTAWIIIRMIFFLVLVIVAIYFVMRFFKNKANPVKSDDEFLRRVSTLNLASGKSIEIVTLLDKGYMLGVTDSNISVIDEIEDKQLINALNLNFDKKQNVKKPMNFSDVLDIFMPNGPRERKNIYGDVENTINNIRRERHTNESSEDENGN